MFGQTFLHPLFVQKVRRRLMMMKSYFISLTDKAIKLSRTLIQKAKQLPLHQKCYKS